MSRDHQLPVAVTVKNCRLCQSTSLETVLDLGSTPLANDFRPWTAEPPNYDHFPLELLQCSDCGHTQLGIIIDPGLLFRNYSYVSGTSTAFQRHFEALAHWLRNFLGLDSQYPILEIGSNDGTLLRYLLRAGYSAFGVEPAKNIFDSLEPELQEHTYNEFFSSSLVAKLRDQSKLFGAVIANNVFAHIADLGAVIKDCHELLVEDGYLIFEVSHVLRVLEDCLFDTIYHEHLDYHSVFALSRFLRKHNFEIVEAIEVQTHGGSVRIVAKKMSHTQISGTFASVSNIVSRELKVGVNSPQVFHNLAQRINELKTRNLLLIDNLTNGGAQLACFGAPAKLTTLLHVFHIHKGIFVFAVDDSPLKQSTWVPGGYFPVVSRSIAREHGINSYFISAWNFADSIIKSFDGQDCTFVTPLPKPHLVLSGMQR